MKKEMEIVVTADTSKAKTSLQNLSDYLKGKDTIQLDTTQAQAQLINVQGQISKLKSEIKSMDISDKAFGEWANALKNAETEADKLKDYLGETNKESKKVDLSNVFKKANKDARRFVFSLFSVRSAWSLISKASRTYLSNNEETSNKVSALWSYLGEVIGGVIERVVNWLQYGIAYINVFVKALSGVDFLAKSIQKTTKATNKELKKTVSSMDEIVNLDLDTSTETSSASALQDIADLELNEDIVNFLDKIADALKSVWDIGKGVWNFLEDNFGVVGASALVGGLALIIGGASTGVLGLYGVLTLVAGVSFVELYKNIQQIKQETSDLQEIEKNQTEFSKSELEKQEQNYKNFFENIDTYSNEQVTNYIKAQGSVVESTTTVIDGLNREYTWYERLTGVYSENMTQLSNYNEKLNNQKTMLEKVIEYYQNENKDLDINSEKYKQNKEIIDSAKKSLEQINNYKAKATIEVDADTSKYETKMGNAIIKFNKKLNNFLTGKGWTEYATGGFPEEGQYFVANEKGPEMVGQIGSSTAVVNNQQIVESVSIGVANAVAGVLGSQKTSSQTATYLYINGSEFAKAVYGDMQKEDSRRNTNTSIRRV